MIRLYIERGAHIRGNPKLVNGYQAFGEMLWDMEGLQPYIYIQNDLPEMNSLPAHMVGAVSKISYHNRFRGKRIEGIYKYRSATAVLNLNNGGNARNEVLNDVRLEATDIADAAELYRLIRIGQILPTESFEQKQIEFDSVRSVLKLAIDVIFRRLDDLHFRVFGS